MSAAPNLVIPASDLNQLKAAGFTQPVKGQRKTVPRISLASEGKTKHGKTHFALFTTPEPVAFISMDPGAPKLVDKAVEAGRKIIPVYIEHNKKENQDAAKKLWESYRKAVRAVMNVKSIRTLVIDTISEAWELIQLAEFGKLKQNNKFAYGGINAEFSGLVDELYYTRVDLNTVYIQRVKNDYVDDKWDGKSTKPAGYRDLDYLVDLSIVHRFNGKDKQFTFETKASEATRFGGEHAGLRFVGEECTFMDLALNIFKDDPIGSDPEYWGMKF